MSKEFIFTKEDHTFVICAYKENPHIEETIESLEKQTLKSNVILCTSTPNEYLKNICKKHQLEIIVNPNVSGLGSDWNYAYSQAKTELITIAHQDDIYEPDFVKNTLEYANKDKNTMFLFTDYYEARNGEKVNSNKLLRIKRMMNYPLSLSVFYSSKFVRRRMLSIGCAICCPSVTFVRKNIGKNPFVEQYKNSCDYATWVKFSKKKGSVIYIKKQLLGHRIYPESTTSFNLSENIRKREDLEILCDFWPVFIAKLINRVYSTSEKSNELETEREK